MIVEVPQNDVARWPIDATMFADITTKEILALGWSDHDDGSWFFVQFAVNLTAAENDQVYRRVTSSGDIDEQLQARAVNAYKALQDYEALAAPTNANTVQVVKLLCKVVRALIRLQLRRLDAVD